ncbi:hypothetical protein DV738_g3944, partial [Chaetothyriales sp. CBS 135597]
MAYSPTGITTSTVDLPSTINKMPVPADIGGPPYSSHPSSRHSSSPRRPTTTGTRSASPQSSSRSMTTTTTTTAMTKGFAVNQDYSEVPESPPLTSFLTDRFAASTAQESVYLSRVRYLRIATYLVSGLIIACAAGSVGTSAHILHSYNSTRSTDISPLLSLWPSNIDNRPVLVTLVPAAVICVLMLSYLLLAAIPSPHSRTRLLTYICLLTNAVTFVLSLTSLLFTTIVTYHVDSSPSTSSYSNSSSTNPRHTILSFTCSFYHGPGRFHSASDLLQLPVFSRIVYPAGFGRLCRESEASWGLMAAIAFLSFLGLCLFAIGFAFDVAINRERNARYGAKYGGGGGITAPIVLPSDP